MAVSPSLRGFAQRLNEARMTQHLSIRAVARVAGVPTATAQGWLNGRHLPAPALRRSFLNLVDTLGLTSELPDDLWDESAEAGADAADPTDIRAAHLHDTHVHDAGPGGRRPSRWA